MGNRKSSPSRSKQGAFGRAVAAVRRAIPVLMVGLLTLGALPAFAQEVSGSIQGRITDPQGAVIPGATVELITDQRTFTSTTDNEGGYSFLRVLPGTHRLRISASGFGTVERNDVILELGRTLQANFELNPAGIGEVVNVTTSDEPIVDITSTKIATNVTKEEFDLIPKTLNFSSVINVAPGVRPEARSGGFTVDGASGAENVFILDGVEVTRVEDGQLGSTKNVPFDFVREVQIKSAGYEAEFGGATGGVINVVTRSGQNDWHGEARFEFEMDELQGEPNERLRLNPVQFDRAEYYFDENFQPDYRLFAPVLSIGGPIVKDKFWFYGSYAPQFEKTEQTLRLIDYDANGNTIVLGERPNERTRKYEYYFGRLDFSPSDKIQAYASFIGSPVKTEGQLIGLDANNLGTSETTSRVQFEDPRHEFKGGYTPSWNFASALTYNPTDSVVLSVRGGRTYLNDKGLSYDIPVGIPLYQVIIPCDPADFGGCPNGTTAPGTPLITNNFVALFNVTTRTNVNVDATYITRFFDQQHIIKGGYQYNRLSNKVDEGYQGGIINIYYNSEFAGERGEFGYWRITDFGTLGDVNSRAQSLFIQDAWTAHPRLTLNLGLRFEHEFLPTFPIDPTFHPTIDPDKLAGAPERPIEFGWGQKIAPRIGVAWDVWGDQRLKVYGSFGVFYDTMKYELPRGSFGGDRFLRSWWTLDTLDFTQLNIVNPIGTLISGPLDFRVPSSLAPEPGEQPGIEPDLDPTRQHEFTLGADYNFATNLLFGVRFTRKVLDRTIEDIGAHDSVGNEHYTIGNPGYGVSQDTTFFAPFPAPRAVREYTGLEFRLDKRFSNNWYANLTYLYSKLYGNYSGLAASDELTDAATGTGRSSPNVNRYYDFPTLLFDAAGNETLGRLATDRPHTFKGYASYRFNWWGMSSDLGAAQFIYSGVPVTTRLEMLFAEHIPFGRGDLGRTEIFSQTDFLFTHRWNITERVAAKFTFNVLNLFDERNALTHYETITGPGFEFPVDESNFPQSAYTDYLTLGFDGVRARLQAEAAANPGEVIIDPRFNLPQAFQAPRFARFGFGIEF